jgi:hypothetical protein
MAEAQVGEVYAFRILGGGHGALQVTAFDPDIDPRHPGKYPKYQLLLLDVDSAEMPGAELVDAAEPAQPDPGDEELWVMQTSVPWWATHVPGTQRQRTPSGHCNGYAGGWEGVAIVAHHRRLERQGQAARPWQHDDTLVHLDLGQGPTLAVRRDHDGLKRGDFERLCPAPEQPIHWQGLQVLSRVNEVTVSGAASGLREALPTWPDLRVLNWTDVPGGELDLRALPLGSVSLRDVRQPLLLRLPPTVRSLALMGTGSALVTVEAPDWHERFGIELLSMPSLALPRGVQDLRKLSVAAMAELDLAALHATPQLADLTVRADRARLSNTGALRDLPNLRAFTAYELYDFDAQAFPTPDDCPGLDWVSIHGLRADSAKQLKARLKPFPQVALDLRKARGAKWLADNLDNPFRDWEQLVNPAFGAKAMKLWVQALNDARRLMAAGTPSEAGVKAVVKALVQGLNRLNRHGEIDTLLREEACDAIWQLGQTHLGAAVPEAQVQAWVDALRDW